MYIEDTKERDTVVAVLGWLVAMLGPFGVWKIVELVQIGLRS